MPARISVRISTAAPLVFAVLGMALFLSATWTARADGSGVSTTVVYVTRVVSFVTYMLVAWLFRSHLARPSALYGVAASLMAAHLVAIFAIPALPLDAGVVAVVSYASAMFEGIANALVTLLFAHVFSTYEPRLSAVAIAVAYLANDVCILLFDCMSPAALSAARPACIVAALVLLMLCVLLRLRSCAGRPNAEEGVPDRLGVSVPAFLRLHIEWAFLLVAAVLFPSLFGVIGQASSVTGGNFALYDVATELAVIAVQLVFLLYVASFGTRFGFASILAFVVPLYATGFALFPNNWSSGNPLAGSLIRAGYVLLTVLMWILVARTSYADPKRTYLYFGIFAGISNAQIGRLAGSALMGSFGPNLSLCQTISLWALWAICIFGLAVFFILWRRGSMSSDRQFSPIAEVEDDRRSRDLPVQKTLLLDSRVPDDFSARLAHLADRAGLTSREREVVSEAVHGYSRTGIAQKLGLSPETVKTYLNRAYVKAGVSSKQELVALVEQESLS
jgi:DNA-binding CsgD family transcriptional regulator